MRSFAEDIRGRSDEALARLLRLRPDLARPQPADLGALAARAGTGASTARAIDDLDLEHLRALQACVALRPRPAELASALGTSAAHADRLLEDLHERALLWRSPEGLRLVRAVPEVLAGDLAGLGPSADDLGHTLPADLDVDSLGSAERAILGRLARGGSTGAMPADPHSATAVALAALLERGLLVRTGQTRVTLPREVALAVRGGRLVDPDEESALPERTAPAAGGADDVDAAAAAAASDVVMLVDELLEHVEALRPRVLRTGGLAVRDTRTLASRCDLTSDRTALLLELALGARLLADDRAIEPTWRLTTKVETWRSEGMGARWAALAAPWLTSLRSAHRPAPEDGKPANVLAEGLTWPPVRALRAELLECLDDLAGPASAAEVVALLRQRRPRRIPVDVERIVTGLLAEAETVGVTGRGALAATGRALRDPDADPAAVLDALAPAPVAHALLQADLTAIVPGGPAPELAELLRRSAVLESRGGASVFRFTDASLRQALDTGWSADDLLEALARSSATPLPQPLEYLVRDVARRHGQVRAGSAGSYVRSDDPTHLEALTALRDLSHLQLRQIAPTVLVSPTSPTVLMEALRDVGASPVLEGSGGVVTTRPTSRRVAPPREHPVTEALAPPPLEVVARLREAQDRADERQAHRPSGPEVPPLDPASNAALLRDAAADRVPVWVGVSDAVGATRRLLFHPEQIDGGRVIGLVDGQPQVLSLHRITGVLPHSGPGEGTEPTR